MNRILIIGAGLSSHYLITYLAKAVQNFQWELTVADASLKLVEEKIKEFPHVHAKQIDILQEEASEELVNQVDIVISLLPAFLQPNIAKICLKLGKHFLSASYLSEEIRRMNATATMRNLIFLNELGLDPGIDHMSAMQIIHHIKETDGKIISFKSFAGALIAPESDNNPWGYKFTWNPRNVVLAGQGVPVKFVENNQYKYIPYQQLFHQTQLIHIEGLGDFEAYANRDSLGYRYVYEIEDIPTILRGTLRKLGFCSAWAVLVNLGLTENGFEIEETEQLTYRAFVEAFLHSNNHENIKKRIALQTGIAEYAKELQKIEWLGLLDYTKIPLKKATPAQILQRLLEEKWKLEEKDKDMIVMQHQITYEKGFQKYLITSDMVVMGEDQQHTAIAKTVGLPLAIATKLILQNKIKVRGVVLPTLKEIYEPILSELQEYGIQFKEKTILI